MLSLQEGEASARREPILAHDLLLELTKVRQRLVNAFRDEIRVFGLTLARARALLALAREGDLTQTTVAAYLEIEGPSAVRLIDELEKGGYVLRQQDSNDRRIKKLILTDSGRQTAQLLNARWEEVCHRTVGGIDMSDQQSALNTMKAMLNNLNR